MPYRISIVGTGYVGLSTSVGFASKGYHVIASTHDAQKATLINKGVSPFYEPDLEENLKKVVKNGNLRCVVGRDEPILNTEITFVAVGTPSRKDGSIELRYIQSSAKEIGEALKRKTTYHLVVVKSTVVPGTTESVVKSAIEYHSGKRCGVNFGLCMNPEFLREGSAFRDTLNPDRIVIGEYDRKSGQTLEALYKDFYRKEVPPIIRTNLQTAELIKYANNAFLATKISFINTIANICEKIPSADIVTVAKSIGLDERISPLFLNAGLGYGGSCFPKDVKALIAHSKTWGYDAELLTAVDNVNKTQPSRATELAKTLLRNLKDKHIAILGLSFKPNTDDMREAVSIKIINKLLEEGAIITAYDPVAIPNAKNIFKNKIKYARSAVACLRNAHCCILVTEWKEFKKLKPEDFSKNMKQPNLIDGRRIYNPKQFSQKLNLLSIGLGH